MEAFRASDPWQYVLTGSTRDCRAWVSDCRGYGGGTVYRFDRDRRNSVTAHLRVMNLIEKKKKRGNMSGKTNEINVTRTSFGAWLVSEGVAREARRSFRVKSHAVAFARALALSGNRRLLVFGAGEIGVLQPAGSLTYPVRLE